MTDTDTAARFDLDGVGLAYEDEGSGDATPLVFIHGWTANRHRWDHQLEHFKSGRRVIRLDLRGHGDSDKPEQTYTIRGLADDVRRLLDDRGVDRFIPIGHSMGGMIAQTLALAHPDRVERMVLVDSLGRMVYSRVRGLEIVAGKALPYNTFVAINIMRAFKPGYPRSEIRKYVAQSQATPKHVVMSCYDAMREFDVIERAGEIQAPVLLLHGYYDIQFPPSEAARLAARLPDAVIKIIDAGHECPIEDPAAVTKAIESFLAQG